jgi:RHS repeat-associated protein
MHVKNEVARFHYVTELRQLALLAVLVVSWLVPVMTATARCYNPAAIASRFEEQLKEEQALTEKTAYTAFLQEGSGMQIGLLRWYDPNLQRFINRDPAGEEEGINLYHCNFNDPINRIDTDGLGSYFSPAAVQVELELEADELGISVDELLARRAAEKALQNQLKEEIHHRLPQQFAKQCKRAGLDIEDFTIKISRAQHRLKPGGLHTGPENWNKLWKIFFKENRNPTKEQIINFLKGLDQRFGINVAE